MGVLRERQNSDGGMSDVVGTLMLLGVTLSLVTVAAFTFSATDGTNRQPLPKLDIALSATPTSLDITHAGGGSFERADLRLVIDTLGVPLLPSETNMENLWVKADPAEIVPPFALGDTIAIYPCASPAAIPDHCLNTMALGQEISISIVSTSRGGVIASGFVLVEPFDSSRLPKIIPEAPTDGQTVFVGTLMHLKAEVVSNSARGTIFGVSVDLQELIGPASWTLNDDGRNGDLIPNDGHYEGYYLIPSDLPVDADPALNVRKLRFSVFSSEGTAYEEIDITIATPGSGGTTGPPRGAITITDFYPKTVAPFQYVRVNGTGFLGADSVQLVSTDATSGTAAVVPVSWVRVAADAIVITAPANSEADDDTYRIRVSSPVSFALSNAAVPLVVAGTTNVDTLPPPPPGSFFQGGSSSTTTTSTTSIVNVGGPVTNTYNNGTGSLPGPQGPPGADGTLPGVDPTDPTLVNPDITGMSAVTGGPGMLVTLTGTNLVGIKSAYFAKEGETQSHGAIWWIEAEAPPGTMMHVLVPDIPEDLYVITVTTEKEFTNAPSAFAVVFPQPLITDVCVGTNCASPTIRAWEQASLVGEQLSTVTLVELSHSTFGQFAVPWSATPDGRIIFTILPSLPAGNYDITVSNGVKSDTEPLGIEVLPPISPQNLALTPASQDVLKQVTVTGDNLYVVNRVTLTDEATGNVYAPTWWLAGLDIVFIVPLEAAPPSTTDVPYKVRLLDAGGIAAPQVLDLTVKAIPPPSLVLDPNNPDDKGFFPHRGPPFTQVTINGTNFVNVQSVTFGDLAVYYAVASPTKILAITHTGMTPNDYPITVRTSTGCFTTDTTALAPAGCVGRTTAAYFHADPPLLVPVYNKSVFDWVGVQSTVTDGSSGDNLKVVVMAKLDDPTWSILPGTKFTPSFLVPEQIGNSNTAVMPFTSVQACGNGVYRLTAEGVPSSQYDSSAFQLKFYLALEIKKGTLGLSETYTVITNDLTQYFVIPPNTPLQEVRDGGNPINGFASC